MESGSWVVYCKFRPLLFRQLKQRDMLPRFGCFFCQFLLVSQLELLDFNH
jgi:hypothetical protein